MTILELLTRQKVGRYASFPSSSRGMARELYYLIAGVTGVGDPLFLRDGMWTADTPRERGGRPTSPRFAGKVIPLHWVRWMQEQVSSRGSFILSSSRGRRGLNTLTGGWLASQS